ncbi:MULTISPECIES: FUSC family protein [unclassified Ornithinimicrobium]|uniref:FUSC family protein n=1 Tax=unclassified Ornithinimicrobium TaxID=2615080 RepID=UPI0038548B2C
MSRARDQAAQAGHAVIDPLLDELTPGAARGRLVRLRARAWLIVQVAAGATAAWWVAHGLLDHPLPFFAPITAMICLGLTYGDRVRRIVELTIGVAIGILTGDLLVHAFGTGLWQIFAVAVVAMALAVLLGAGQLLMMQAGIQGVMLTVLVAGDGEALSRWLDAVVGGGVALLIAMLAPVRSTTQRPRERAIAIVGHLAEVLTETTQALRNRDHGRASTALRTARELSRELESLRATTAEASAAARLAPLLSGEHRDDVREIQGILGPLDLAIRNVRVLARRAEAAVEDEEFVPDTYIDMVAGLAEAAATVQEQLERQGPLSATREDLVNLARRSTWSHPRAGLSAEVMRAQVRSTVVDLLVLSGMQLSEARRRLPATREEFDPSSPDDAPPTSPQPG